jgi:hypothetical protein
MNDIKDFFNTNGYVVIRNIVDVNIATLMYAYVIEQAQRSNFKYINDYLKYDAEWDGTWSDGQVPGSFSKYGDPLFDILLNQLSVQLSQMSGRNLEPTYSYFRLYKNGDVLARHRDRPSCEISATLCLGHNITNVDKNKYLDYNWPMWVQSKDGQELPVGLNPGDLILYKGCEIDHWREEYMGLNHAQVFLHFNDAEGPYANKWDGRQQLSIPKIFQRMRKTNDFK